MTKEVLVSLSGLQNEFEEDEALEIVTPATYYQKNGKHYIRYEEFLEEEGAATQVTLKLAENSVEVLKRGESSVHMIFELGKLHTTAYQMPLGMLMMGIHTTYLKLDEEENEINADIRYGLNINSSFVSDCQVKIKVVAR